jgi:hypothetical protein
MDPEEGVGRDPETNLGGIAGVQTAGLRCSGPWLHGMQTGSLRSGSPAVTRHQSDERPVRNIAHIQTKDTRGARNNLQR